MLQFAAPVLAFGAALLGVLGQTFDPKRKGLHKITRIGWFTLSLALFSLAFGLWQIHVEQREQRTLQTQRAQLREIGTREICSAALQLKAAFDIQHAAASRKTLADGRDLGFTFAALQVDDALQALLAIDLLRDPPARPAARDSRPLWSVVSHRASEFWTRTNTTLAKYGEFLDVGLVIDASLLINDNYVQWLLELPTNVEHLRQTAGYTLAPLQPHQMDEFQLALDRLEALLGRTGGDAELLACQPIEIAADAK